MKVIKTVLAFFIPFLLMHGCNDTQQSKPLTKKDVDNQLIEANKSRIEVESDRIDGFVERRGWQVEKTGTGLRYMIYQEGEGKLAQTDDIVKVNYSVSLLNGAVCYSSDSTGAEEFKVGLSDVESGLHEGIQFLNEGAKAKFILPAHLAHGLIGDENRIPSNAVIIYDIELLAIR